MKKFVSILSVLVALCLVIGCFAACSKDAEDPTNATTDGNVVTDGNVSAGDVTGGDVTDGNVVEDVVVEGILKVIDIPLTEEQYAFAVTKGNTELLEQLNAFLAEIQENGKFDEIMNKYFGDGTPEGVLIADATVGASDNQLVIATNAQFAPFEYVEGEYYYGVDIEIMNLFAQSLGKTLAVNDMEFDSVCTAVGEGMCDVAASGLTIKPEREEILDFSTSYYNASQKIIAPAADTAFDACETAADAEAVLAGLAEGTKVGYQTGTTGGFYVVGDADWDFAGFANLEGVGYSNGAFAVQDIINGNIAYVVIDEAPANNIVAGVNG